MFKLLKYAKEKWYLYLIVAGAIILQCYLQLLLPEYMGNITTLIVSDNADKVSQIWTNGGWMILISCGVFITAIIQNYLGALISAHVGEKLREATFHKVNSFNQSNYNKFGTATLITRTTNDVEQVKTYILMSIKVVVMSPTYMIIGLIKTLTQDAVLSIVLAFCIPVIVILMCVIMYFATPLFKQIQIKLDNLTVALRGNLTGIRVVRAYNQQKTEYNRFDKANRDMTKINKKANQIMSVVSPLVTVIFNLTYIGIYALGFYLLDGTSLFINAEFNSEIANTITNVSVVAQYSLQIMQSFLMLAMIAVMYPQASACAKRINEVLSTENPFDETAVDASKTESYKARKEYGIISFKNVSFSYPDSDKPCISNISFETKPGKTTAIIGSTGSGKSTVINLIPRFYDATSGSIELDGIDVKDLNVCDLRDSLGFVPQKAVLFKGTIRDNIKFGNPEASNEEVYEALNVAQAGNFVSKLPDKLDSYVAQGGKNFSGGQKQRLAIARALIKRPEVYVFDDSFSALDFKTDAKLRHDLKKYIGNSSMIVVAQRVSSILDADTIIVLNDGQMVGKGTHTELLQNCPVYQDIVKSQLDPEEVQKTIDMMKQATLEGGN